MKMFYSSVFKTIWQAVMTFLIIECQLLEVTYFCSLKEQGHNGL